MPTKPIDHARNPFAIPRWNLRFGAAAFAVLAALLLGEIALRFSGIAGPGWVRADPVVGWSYLPGSKYLHQTEGFSQGTLNAHGLRDVDHQINKPTGYRILILGDSFTEAFQVPLEDSFARHLERNLNSARGAAPAEVIVLARSGMGTTQQLRWFETRGAEYRPDLVLLQTCVNDPVDNVPTLGGRECVPYHVWKDGHLTLDDSFRSTSKYHLRDWFSGLRNRSAVVELMFRVARGQQGNPAACEAGIGGSLDINAFENHYARCWPKPWEQALETTSAVLVKLRDRVAASGAQLVVFGATDGIELEAYGQEAAAVWDLDLERRERWWKQQCDQFQIPFVALLAEFRKHRAETGKSPHGFGDRIGYGHWNELGHEWAAEILAAGLCDLVGNGQGEPERATAANRNNVKLPIIMCVGS